MTEHRRGAKLANFFVIKPTDTSCYVESACNAGDPGSVPGSGRPPGKGNATHSSILRGLSGSSVGKESTCNAGDLGSIPRSGRFPGEGLGYPLQCSGLENSMDRGAWWATIHEVAES